VTDAVDRGFRKTLLLALAVGANLGGMATPLGSGPNGIAIAATRGPRPLDFLDSMSFGVPLVLGMLLLAFTLLVPLMIIGCVLVTLSGTSFLGLIHRHGDVPFVDVLASPRRGTSLGVGGLLFGAVLRADGRIPLGAARGDRQSYLALGLRVTGLWGPALGGWDFDEYDNDVDDGPSGNLAGVYAALVIGWGGTSVNPAH
jgi:hypothetical protein